MCRYMCADVLKLLRDQPCRSLLWPSTSAPIRLGYLVSKLQESRGLWFPRAQIINTQPHILLCVGDLGIEFRSSCLWDTCFTNSSLHACFWWLQDRAPCTQAGPKLATLQSMTLNTWSSCLFLLGAGLQVWVVTLSLSVLWIEPRFLWMLSKHLNVAVNLQ